MAKLESVRSFRRADISKDDNTADTVMKAGDENVQYPDRMLWGPKAEMLVAGGLTAAGLLAATQSGALENLWDVGVDAISDITSGTIDPIVDGFTSTTGLMNRAEGAVKGVGEGLFGSTGLVAESAGAVQDVLQAMTPETIALSAGIVGMADAWKNREFLNKIKFSHIKDVAAKPFKNLTWVKYSNLLKLNFSEFFMASALEKAQNIHELSPGNTDAMFTSAKEYEKSTTRKLAVGLTKYAPWILGGVSAATALALMPGSPVNNMNGIEGAIDGIFNRAGVPAPPSLLTPTMTDSINRLFLNPTVDAVNKPLTTLGLPTFPSDPLNPASPGNTIAQDITTIAMPLAIAGSAKALWDLGVLKTHRWGKVYGGMNRVMTDRILTNVSKNMRQKGVVYAA